MVELAVGTGLLVAVAWVYSEFRMGRSARLALGVATAIVAAMAAAGVRELQYRHFAFRVTQALEELSAAVRHGHGEDVHAPIQTFTSAVKHDPSLAAAVDLADELKRINSGTASDDYGPMGEKDPGR